MKTKIFLFLSSAFLFVVLKSVPAIAGGISINPTSIDNTNAKAVSDSQFLMTAYSTGQFEIKAGKLARRMTTDKTERKFARKMIQENTCIDKDLLALFAQKGYAAPKVVPVELKTEYKALNQLMADEFNQKYSAVTIQGRKDAIVLYTSISSNSNDAALSQFAKRDLSLLQTQEAGAQAVQVHLNTPSTNKSTW